MIIKIWSNFGIGSNYSKQLKSVKRATKVVLAHSKPCDLSAYE